MFATPAIAFHTILSLVAIGTGAWLILAMSKDARAPSYCAPAFLITMIATDVTGFFLPATMLLPSHIVGILSLVLIAIALAASYAFHFTGAWRWIYAVTMGVAIYLNFFVLVTQLFLKVGFLHALAPHAPDNPESPFLIAQTIVLAIFAWLIWKSVKNFQRT
jgi:hypothetical protein